MSEHRKKASLEDALHALPIFPLPQVVLFPEAQLPLHVFEPRYRALLADCLASHGALAIVRALPGEDEWGRPRIERVCTGGIILEHQPLADGRSNIVVVGQARLELDELEPEDPPRHPYRLARARLLEEGTGAVPVTDATALASAATMFAAAVKTHDASFSFAVPRAASPGRLADLCAFQLIVDAGARQRVLEELEPRARVKMVLKQLALQHGAMMKDDGSKVLN